jgi:hypothetical protein
MSTINIDELQLERVRAWNMYMETVFAPRNEEEFHMRDEMRKDWDKLYEGINKLPKTMGIKK